MSKTRTSFYKVFLRDDSPDVEVFSGITALMASLTHLVFSEDAVFLYGFASFVFGLQILAAYPIYSLTLRHNTNIVSFAIAMIISYLSMPESIANITLCESASVGGFAGVGLTCLYSSFKTQFQRKSIKR